MAALYRRAMDLAYLVCVWVAGTALVLISAVIPWGVYTRYVLNSAASWPEPTAVLLTIVLTFYGAAACYRLGTHMNVTVAIAALPPRARRAVDFLVEIIDADLRAVHGGLRLQAVRCHLEQHHRRISRAARRHRLFADPLRRGIHPAVHHRASHHRPAGVRGRSASADAGYAFAAAS